jgi:repressor LexA
MFSLDNIIATVRLDGKLFNIPDDDSNDYFIMRADGNGMVNAGVHNNDMMIFKKTDNAPFGSLVAVEYKGDLMFRRLLQKDSNYVLRRENNETPDIITDEIRILGVLVSLVRNFVPQ